MAFGSFDRKSSPQPMAEINMVPLIDVVLVLLVIFIVTAPLLTNAVKLDLPKATSSADIQKPEKVEFAIDVTGALFWNGERISRDNAIERFAEAGRKRPQPEVYLRADQNVAYRYVAEMLADASKAGLSKVAFVSEPVK
jgi:biopolymer transport protein ExbD